ncbi:GspE/PulE family protein [Clostridium guangxiense]|uniref:GspE/PulE family protein n=1 Tax=Clostridium guangxiense TaxID=1662055 RepID=UPI001E5E7EE5|nr:type II/IV secretion system protein [Clostridium guangxiense]MCD2346461.1 Flp pilus assembly complex ATPase component TadA [Clostridium guangxiense]
MKYVASKKLGDLLVDYGIITKEQLESALKKQKYRGKRIGEILVSEKIVTEDEIVDVLQMQTGIPKAYFDEYFVDKKAVLTIPEGLAQKYNLIPISFNGDKLNVAMSDPMNMFALDDVRIASGYEVVPMIATSTQIRRAIETYYTSQKIEKAAAEATKNYNISPKEIDDNEAGISRENVNEAPIVKLVDFIIREAVRLQSSDIHIEPFEKYIRVRYRIDGELHEKQKIQTQSLQAIMTRIKIISNLNIAEKRLPQDGRMKVFIDGKNIDLRVSILPTIFGEKAVIRILKNDSKNISKEKLGMGKESMQKLENIIKSPYGIILTTGPTGSGKSTTLYAILKELNDEHRNIVTVEDPVEYMMEGINQVNVNVKAGLTFSSGLRAILRQDPDIIMIGEMRDNETAEIAVRAAITGHLVLSTIHTNGAAASIIRLFDMGIQPYLVANSLSGIIAQRLVKRICPNCREEYEAKAYEKKILGIDNSRKIILYRGKGCPKCNGTGYLGRTGVYEIMEITKEMRDKIVENPDIDFIERQAIENGMSTIRSSCEKLVYEGKTTIDELIKIAFLGN